MERMVFGRRRERERLEADLEAGDAGVRASQVAVGAIGIARDALRRGAVRLRAVIVMAEMVARIAHADLAILRARRERELQRHDQEDEEGEELSHGSIIRHGARLRGPRCPVAKALPRAERARAGA